MRPPKFKPAREDLIAFIWLCFGMGWVFFWIALGTVLGFSIVETKKLLSLQTIYKVGLTIIGLVAGAGIGVNLLFPFMLRRGRDPFTEWYPVPGMVSILIFLAGVYLGGYLGILISQVQSVVPYLSFLFVSVIVMVVSQVREKLMGR